MMPFNIVAPVFGITLLLTAGLGWLLAYQLEKNGELKTEITVLTASLETEKTARQASDQVLVDREKTVTQLRAEVARRHQQLQKVEADACLDTAVPDELHGLFNTIAGDRGP